MDPQSKLGAGELLKMFKFIPTKQLLELRQVAKDWNEGALPILRKRLDLNFTLTRDYSRNLDFFHFLSALPENGFVASVMKLKTNLGKEAWQGYTMNLAEGSVYSFPGVLIEICKIFGTGNGPVIKKFMLEMEVTSAFMLSILRHLSPSLEILDMEFGDLDFLKEKKNPLYYISKVKVFPETHELKLALFKDRFPLNNLKKIKMPRCVFQSKLRHQDFIEWFEILVKSAPNLANDPISEFIARMKQSLERVEHGEKANVATTTEKRSDTDNSTPLHQEDDDEPSVQLGTDELEILSKFIPSPQLLELRRVSNAWNEAALPVLRKRHDLKFTLTEDPKRNWEFLKFLRSLPENGFVASEMNVRGRGLGGTYEACPIDWTVVDLEKGSVETPLDIWIEICKHFLAGMSGRTIRKLTFNCNNDKCMLFADTMLTSDIMLLMLRLFSTSLEILDMEWGFCDFGLNKKTLDEALDHFKRSPFTKLKMIVPPSQEIQRLENEEEYLVGWLNILVQSAPNLTNDPVAECKVDASEYYEDDDDSDDDAYNYHGYCVEDDEDRYHNYRENWDDYGD